MPQLDEHQPEENYAVAHYSTNYADYGHWAQYHDNPYRDNPWHEEGQPRAPATVGCHLYVYRRAPLVYVCFSEELRGAIHLSIEPDDESPRSRKCPTHACPSWPNPWRVLHTTSPRTFSLRVCNLNILRTVSDYARFAGYTERQAQRSPAAYARCCGPPLQECPRICAF